MAARCRGDAGPSQAAQLTMGDDFYVRYYVGHKGKFGHEFLEFEFRPDGKLRYANNSNYKNDTMIRKEVFVTPVRAFAWAVISKVPYDSALGGIKRLPLTHPFLHAFLQAVMNEVKRVIEESEILKEDDGNWPEPDRIGRQELEVVIGNEHISFATTKIGSLLEVQQSKDAEGLKVFYYLVQDLKCLVFSLVSLHFKIQPIAR